MNSLVDGFNDFSIDLLRAIQTNGRKILKIIYKTRL